MLQAMAAQPSTDSLHALRVVKVSRDPFWSCRISDSVRFGELLKDLAMRDSLSLIAVMLCWLLLHPLPAARAEQQVLTLIPPSAEPLEPSPGEPIPYFAPLPTMKVDSWRVDDSDVEPLSVVQGKTQTWLYPPLLRVTYVQTGPRPTSQRWLAATYAAALSKAGWEVTQSAGSTIAHFAGSGRNIWLKFRVTAGTVQIALSDVGANVAATRLSALLHKTGKATIYGITFDINKAQLRPDSQTILQQVLKLLQSEPALKLEIQVHSAKGTQQSYSRKLSVERARTIQQWLLQHGVEQARLLARGYEDSVLVRDNWTDEGFALNRRVVLVPIP